MSKALIQLPFETHMPSNIIDSLRYLGAFSFSFLAQLEKSIARKRTKVQPPQEKQRKPRGIQEIILYLGVF